MTSYWIETLGCPKNAVDSAKLAGLLDSTGHAVAVDPESADVILVNTCSFIESARAESIEVILDLSSRRQAGAKVVATGCMAERYGDELARAIPELELVAGFGQWPLPRGVPVTLGARPPTNDFDLLNLPRPHTDVPWAYLKVAEGCDRRCGFCAIPSFRGRQRSRSGDALLDEARSLVEGGVKELVLVAQDLVSFGLDLEGRKRGAQASSGRGGLQPLVRLLSELRADGLWLRLLYLYPSGLTEPLIEAVVDSGVPYFDLSLQHVAPGLLRGMRRWGNGDKFLDRISRIRELAPSATFRSSFILGYPGETEEDQRHLVRFLEAAELDWAGFFTFSRETGTLADGLGEQVPAELARERLAECSELQDALTRASRDALVGDVREVLVDRPGVARSVSEAPEIDGVIRVPTELEVGAFHKVRVSASLGTDLEAVPA
jgi:ribosomal protein S12 methylthiotransferase